MVDASLQKNEAWDMVELSARRKPIGSKWVFKMKMNAEGKVDKYKARLVEKEQIDVKKTFLHGDPEEEIYMKKSEGFVVKGKKKLVVCTRPYISHAVGVLSRFMSKPGKEHWTTMKRVFRYSHGTIEYGLCFQGRPGLDSVLDIHGFIGADWAGDLDQRRSTSGYVYNLFGGAVIWMSKR
eukprot:PITA_21731